MENTPQFGFKTGYVPDLPPDLAPQDSVVGDIGDSKNFRVVDGHLEAAIGYELMQDDSILGTPLATFTHVKVDGTKVFLIFTTTDVYRWDSTNLEFRFATEVYATGQVSCAGATTTVEGTATDFSTASIAANDQIGFGNDDPNEITTWYTVASVTDADTLELTANGPNTGGDVDYVIRKVYAATSTYRWDVDSFYDSSATLNYCVATNGVDPPIMWDGDDSTPSYFTDVSADAPKAVHVRTFAGRIVFGNIIEARGSGLGEDVGYGLVWCAVQNVDEYDGTTTSGALELYNTPGEIMGMERFMNYLCVVKTDAVILLEATGSSDSPFQPAYVVMGQGSDYRTLGRLGKQLIGFITEDDIVVFDGTPSLQTIADSRVRDTFFDNLNTESQEEVFSIVEPYYKSWRIFVPGRDSSSADRCWVYSIEDDLWQYDDVEMAAAGVYRYVAGTTVSETGRADGATTYTLESPAGSYNGSGDTEVRVKEDISGEASTGYIEVDSDSYYYSSKDDGTKTFTIGTDPEGVLPSSLSQDYSEDDEAWVATVTVSSLDTETPDSFSSAEPYENLVLFDSDGYVFIEREELKTRSDQEGTENDIDASAETADVSGVDPDSMDRWLLVNVHYKDTGDENDTLDVSISPDTGYSYESARTVSMTGDSVRKRARVAFNASGRTCRVRYEGRHFIVYGQQYFYTHEGAR